MVVMVLIIVPIPPFPTNQGKRNVERIALVVVYCE